MIYFGAGKGEGLFHQDKMITLVYVQSIHNYVIGF